MEHFNQKICRLELICLMEVNMIRNNDMVDAIKIKNYTYRQCLSSNVLHNCNFNEIIIKLEYLFRWRYEEGSTADIPFRVNKHIY